MRKGIVLAGGSGTRLYPLTRGVSKQLMGIYDKPMIYYPLSVLMLAGIRDILVITTPEDASSFRRLLGDGSHFGVSLTYAVQERPEGIAQAFLLGRDFIAEEGVALVLGDNIFFGHQLPSLLRKAMKQTHGATVFGYQVKDPQRYGVVGFDRDGKVTSIEEKPDVPKSAFAVTGLYFYDRDVVDLAASLRPSPRGELEITDLNRLYLERGDLQVTLLGRGIAWLDTGTHDSLLQASNFIQVIQERQGQMVACLEEIAFRMGFIGAEEVLTAARLMGKSAYGAYLKQLVEEAGRPFP
ncbi:MAG: glucose-1-phosphate thymidylyltransferase RfbA [Magnetococcales bacterium]|nr:glucose-1-phosphate thymidylyltransferase RfbA [Magnetococcales bacterium]